MTLLGCIVLMQRIVVPNLNIDFSLILIYVAILVLFFIYKVNISRSKLILFVIFAVFVIISSFLSAAPFSENSLLLLIICYFPFIFTVEFSTESYLRIINSYQKIMIFCCAVAFMQDAVQVIYGWQAFPNMDLMLPKSWIVDNFVYIQHVKYGSQYIKPNAFFFREVSFLSQFVAIAMVIEFTYFMRPIHLIIYTFTIFLCLAGTGLLLIAIMAPMLFVRLPSRWKVISGLATLLTLGAALYFGWFGEVGQRVTEYQDPQSSSYGRFIYPITLIMNLPNSIRSLISGAGPGNSPSFELGNVIAISKMIIEYGVFSTIAFYVFMVWSLFYKAPSRRIGLSLFILFNILGAYLLVPVIPMLMVALGILPRPTKPPGSFKENRLALAGAF